MVRHGQPAQRQQSENRRQRREQNRHFKRDDDVRRPAMQRPSRDVDGKIPDRHVILQQVSREPADDSADEHDERQLVLVQMQRVAEFFDGKRRVRVQLAIALLARRTRRRYQPARRVEFGHQAVNRFNQPAPPPPLLPAAGVSGLRKSRSLEADG